MEEVQTFPDVEAYLSAAYGPPSERLPEDRVRYEEVFERLRKLDALVRPAVGQLVLVIWNKMETAGCSMGLPARLAFPHLEQSLAFARLIEPGIVYTITTGKDSYRSAEIDLAAEKHVAAYRSGYGWKTEVHEGPIRQYPLSPYALSFDVPIEPKEPPFLQKHKKIEVIAGDEALFTWAEVHSEELLIRQVGLALGESITFPALERKLSERRKSIASAIEPAWIDLARHRKRVDAITKAGREGAGFISLDGVSVTPCENSDDAFWISLGNRERAKEARGTLVRRLDELKELGGLSDDLPNIHLLRHVSQQLNYSWE